MRPNSHSELYHRPPFLVITKPSPAGQPCQRWLMADDETPEDYLRKHHLAVYIRDAVAAAAEADNPVSTFADHLTQIERGHNVLGREFGYISATPHNRRMFLLAARRCLTGISEAGENGKITSPHLRRKAALVRLDVYKCVLVTNQQQKRSCNRSPSNSTGHASMIPHNFDVSTRLNKSPVPRLPGSSKKLYFEGTQFIDAAVRRCTDSVSVLSPPNNHIAILYAPCRIIWRDISKGTARNCGLHPKFTSLCLLHDNVL